MPSYITLFKELFPKNRNNKDRCFARLYPKVELDYYGEAEWIIQITVNIELDWHRLTDAYDVTELRLHKIKEWHEQLSEPF